MCGLDGFAGTDALDLWRMGTFTHRRHSQLHRIGRVGRRRMHAPLLLESIRQAIYCLRMLKTDCNSPDSFLVKPWQELIRMVAISRTLT